MVENDSETYVAVSAIDGNRFIGVIPPLDNLEISELQEANILLGEFTIKQISEPEPATTLITVSDASDILRSPDGRTKRAVFVATNMAEVLRYSRSGEIHIIEEPVIMTGNNSAPSNPYTD